MQAAFFGVDAQAMALIIFGIGAGRVKGTVVVFQRRRGVFMVEDDFIGKTAATAGIAGLAIPRLILLSILMLTLFLVLALLTLLMRRVLLVNGGSVDC